MPNFDQFENVFRSSLRYVYKYRKRPIRSVLVVTDRSEKDLAVYLSNLKRFLTVLGPSVKWTIFDDEIRFTAIDLLEKVEQEKPDLICTYRNLHSPAWKYPYSLGDHLDVLLQKTERPVMILPHPDDTSIYSHSMINTNRVMAMADHLVKDHRLIDYAIAFTEPKGILFLSHIEDEKAFNRFIDAVSKIPNLDWEKVKKDIMARLLKEPSNYIDSCAAEVKKQKIPIEIEKVVRSGHHISEYKRLIERNEIDLLIMNSKEDGQLAMHGLTYPLAVELRQISLLFL